MGDRRKEELEKKRLKLAELRRAREIRTKQMTDTKKETAAPAAQASGASSEHREIYDLVNSLVGDRSSTPTTPTTATSQDMRTSTDGGRTFGGSDGSATPPLRQIPEFTSVGIMIFDIPPKERVVYNKEAQTQEGSFDVQALSEEEIRKRILEEKEQEEKARQAALEEEMLKQQSQEEKEELKELSEEEKRAIVTSNEFIDFIDHSSKLIERALNEKYDFMRDYTVSDSVESDESLGKKVKSVCAFLDDKWSKNRSVTDVSWSPKYAELVATSYNKNQMSVNEPDGVVCVWNLHLLERPEFVFHSQSDVLTTMFSHFHPNLIIGGTYSGQIVLWDTRAKSLPVLKTPLSASGHTHPVYSMAMVGTQNAHNLITASTDGLVCSWQLDMLAQPQETLELIHPAHSKTDEISVTAFGFPDNETTTFWVGTEEGNVYQANRYDRAGSKAGINQYDTYRGHYGTITSLDFHPLFGPVDFSDLFITCSVDWTIKLWRAKSVSKPSTSLTTIQPLYSFDHASDYVYDAKWSPTNPALFGSVDGSGNFDIWNLTADIEVPVVSTLVGNGKALNKLSWDRDGRKAAVGSSDGHVYVYDIGEMASPRSDDWSQLQKVVSH
ncbi:uncharacterized protein VTP21DRAFT_5969 [Calcarisporiella thermophila]|uniref:uncharacterized protein n=1 Tax=Calcarisporiella thermophila TaxID=911321 RepID=UPI00374350FD